MASDPLNILGKVVRSSTWIAKIQNPQSSDFIKTILIFFVQNPVVTQLLLLCVPSLCQSVSPSVCQTSDLIEWQVSHSREYNQLRSVILFHWFIYFLRKRRPDQTQERFDWAPSNPPLVRVKWLGLNKTDLSNCTTKPSKSVRSPRPGEKLLLENVVFVAPPGLCHPWHCPTAANN